MVLVSYISGGVIAIFLGPPLVTVPATSTCEIGVTPADPRFSSTDPVFLPLPGISTNDTHQLLLFSRASNKQWKMSQYTANDNNNFFNNSHSFNTVWNNYIVTDDRAQLLTWLSPLEPNLRHRDIRERRVSDVGEWMIQGEEFRRWCRLDGEGEGDKAVLFCSGNPGVGKTFIR